MPVWYTPLLKVYTLSTTVLVRVGDFDAGHTGILFTVPIGRALGLRRG